MSPPELFDYDWAEVRVVPHAHRGGFETVGVVLHARRAHFLGVRLAQPGAIAARCDLNSTCLGRFLEAYRRVGEADNAGLLGRLPPSERFHWMTAARSTVLQTSPIHTGRTHDAAASLDHLFRQHVAPALV